MENNINTQILDLLLKRDLLLQRVSNNLSKQIANEYIKIINNALDSFNKQEISIINMNKIIKEISKRFEFDYDTIAYEQFKELGIAEAKYIPNGINALVGVDIVNKVLPEPLIEKVINASFLDKGLLLKDAFAKFDDNLKNVMINEIRNGVLIGATNQQMISNMKPLFNAMTSNNLDSLIKTSVSTVVNDVRMQTYKENESIFKGYQHISTLDLKTTFICVARDGFQWTLEYKPIGHKLPFRNVPIHFRCRSVILPITKSYRELGLDIDEISEGTRASMNGSVPEGTTFNKWFESQSKTNQEKYLGVGRYQLYKDGKITLSQLVNQQGAIIAIKDLNKLSDVVVKKDNSINTINSQNIKESMFKLSRYSNAVSKNLSSYEIDYVDGAYSGIDEVLGKYKTNGKVSTFGITNKAAAQYVPSGKWQPEDHFKIGDVAKNYKQETTVSESTIKRWQERINPNIIVNTTANHAKSKFEYAKILMSHEAWHKVDSDNGLVDIFKEKLYKNGIIKDKLEDLSYGVSYYAGKASTDELFAEIGALYSNDKKDLIPKELLKVFEETIEKVKK